MVASCDDRGRKGSQTKKFKWPVDGGKGEETDDLLESAGGTQNCRYLHSSPGRPPPGLLPSRPVR